MENSNPYDYGEYQDSNSSFNTREFGVKVGSIKKCCYYHKGCSKEEIKARFEII